MPRMGLDVIPSELNKDPTLQRSRDVVCASCSHQEAVFFQVIHILSFIC
jgi:hypothetical protein